MGSVSLDVDRQAGALGAIVHGLDLREPVASEVAEAVHAALLEHLVVCIRGQAHITPGDQIAFAAQFGTIEPHPYVAPIEGHPEIIRIYDPNPITETWHADFTYAADPPGLSFLHAQVIPPFGGDTMFANAYAVFDGLSEGLKATLRTLKAYHRGTDLALSTGLTVADIERVHPVVTMHPETRREVLFVNGNYVKYLDGWTVEESAPLLAFLYEQFARPEYSYRHRWQAGDLLIWDNRCTQHRVVGDTGGQDRSLHRVTVSAR